MNGKENRPCAEYEALFEDRLHEAAEAPAGAGGLPEHVRECASCRVGLEDARASAQLLGIAQPTPDPGPGFARMVMARIRAQQHAAPDPATVWRMFVWLGWRFAATAALAAALLAGYNLRTSGTANEPVVENAMQAGTVHDLFSTGANGRVLQPANRDETLLVVAESGDHESH